jgi:glutamate racemase
MMKDVLNMKPKTKNEGLTAFAEQGFLLIDATYTPVNHTHLAARERDTLILADLPLLIEELQKYAAPETKMILVKANICRQLETPLTDRGFTVLNHGTIIPFPSNGQQSKFRESVRRVLGSRSTQ